MFLIFNFYTGNNEEPYYENDDKLLVPDTFAKNQPRPPLLPPPEIKSDPTLEKNHMLKIIKKSQHENNIYPSMNPNALVLKINLQFVY